MYFFLIIWPHNGMLFQLFEEELVLNNIEIKDGKWKIMI